MRRVHAVKVVVLTRGDPAGEASDRIEEHRTTQGEGAGANAASKEHEPSDMTRSAQPVSGGMDDLLLADGSTKCAARTGQLDRTACAGLRLQNVEARADTHQQVAFVRCSRGSCLDDGNVPPRPLVHRRGVGTQRHHDIRVARKQGLFKLHDRWLQLNPVH